MKRSRTLLVTSQLQIMLGGLSVYKTQHIFFKLNHIDVLEYWDTMKHFGIPKTNFLEENNQVIYTYLITINLLVFCFTAVLLIEHVFHYGTSRDILRFWNTKLFHQKPTVETINVTHFDVEYR